MTRLTITHPHTDHIQDIANVKKLCAPAVLTRLKYDWEDVKVAENGPYDNLDDYVAFQGTYAPPADLPDFGMSIQHFWLTPDEAKQVNKAKYINNSSMVIVATVKGTRFTVKFLFGGDMETAGWEVLLKKAEFREAVKDMTFYIVSHQGHQSGFSELLYAAMGSKPIFNIASIHHNDEDIDFRIARRPTHQEPS